MKENFVVVKLVYGENGLHTKDILELAEMIPNGTPVEPIQVSAFTYECSLMGFVSTHLMQAIEYEPEAWGLDSALRMVITEIMQNYGDSNVSKSIELHCPKSDVVFDIVVK